MLNLFKSDGRRQAIREDRRYIVGRARRFLLSYLAADELQKQRYYELIAGAVEECQPQAPDPNLLNTEESKLIAEMAFRVVKGREQQSIADTDKLQTSITDAYATVAMAYRRAAAMYVPDEEMQQIGTAAVHMVTIANSYMGAQPQQMSTAAS